MPSLNSKEKFRKIFPALKAPLGGLPQLKTKIADISSDDLGDLIAKYSAWREYAEDLHITALSEYLSAKDAYDLKYNELMITSVGDTVTERKSFVESSPSIQPLATKLQRKEMLLKMFAGKLESFSNSLTMLSRELTRRGFNE